MVKKSIILMVVFGLTSIANAITVTINDWMTATIYETDGITEWDGSPIRVCIDPVIKWTSTSGPVEYHY